MQFMLIVIGWCLLFAVAWPLALLILFLLPVLWLLSLPLRFLGAVVAAALALVKTLLFLPARLLGYKG